MVQDTASLSWVIITREGLFVHYSKHFLLAKIDYLENVLLNIVKMNIFESY